MTRYHMIPKSDHLYLVDHPELGPNVFLSDKYPWCEPDFFPMKFSDPLARRLIRAYADFVRTKDPELATDLGIACAVAGGRDVRHEDDSMPDTDTTEETVSPAGEVPTGDGDASGSDDP